MIEIVMEFMELGCSFGIHVTDSSETSMGSVTINVFENFVDFY